MAKAVISDIRPVRPIRFKSIKTGIAKFIDVPGHVRINETLPFRVRFINIGIESYSSTNVPPIGIAIVGVNNYVI